MSSASSRPVPGPPRVISPSPTPSDASTNDYFRPVTRSISRASRAAAANKQPAIHEDGDSSSSDPDLRARSRSRSPSRLRGPGRRRGSGLPTIHAGSTTGRRKPDLTIPTGPNGHLSPESANKRYWRELSRSPSPLGLIPIHQTWRSFIHRHEIPRKFLHVSIGFLTLYLYTSGAQPVQIHNVLLGLLIPITTVDFIRHRRPDVNRFYIRCLGALMRESEVDGWNGVISYLLGAFLVLRFLPKDLGVVSILLLSWCDTAASTFGRLWGRYTPQVRRGKSLAGSIAAFIVGVGTAAFFWGWLAPKFADFDFGENSFAFQSFLTLPESARALLGWNDEQGSVTGKLAIGAMSLWAGFVASTSEAIDLFGWDDNLTIPVLCGAGLWGFLKLFART